MEHPTLEGAEAVAPAISMTRMPAMPPRPRSASNLPSEGGSAHGEEYHREELVHRDRSHERLPHPSEINPEWQPPPIVEDAVAGNNESNMPKRRNVDGMLEPAADYMARLHAWRAAQNDQRRANTAPAKSCPMCGHKSPLRCHRCRNEACNHIFARSSHPKAVSSQQHRAKKRKERVAKDHSECVLCKGSLKAGQLLAVANCAEERTTALLEQIRRFNKTCRDSSTSVCGIRSLDINAILRSGARVIAAGRAAQTMDVAPACGRTAHLACMKKMIRERVDPDHGRVYPKCPYCHRPCALRGGLYYTEVFVNQTAFLQKVPKKRRVGAPVEIGRILE